jgi:hypothetical protein
LSVLLVGAPPAQAAIDCVDYRPGVGCTGTGPGNAIDAD